MTFCLQLIDNMCFAIIPAVGFALMFNVPPKALKYCACLGAIGYGCRTFLLYMGFSLVPATFFASTLIGSLGIHLSHRYLAHPKVFTVASIVPMIPGVYAYKAMIATVRLQQLGYSEALFEEMLTNLMTTTFLIGALAFGLSFPGMLFYRRRPVV